MSYDEKLFELVIEVFSAINMNTAVLWLRETLRFLTVYQYFRGSCFLHIRAYEYGISILEKSLSFFRLNGVTTKKTAVFKLFLDD